MSDLCLFSLGMTTLRTLPKTLRWLTSCFSPVQHSSGISSPHWLFVRRRFRRWLAVSMASAQKFNDNPLSTNRQSFIVTIVFYPCSTIPFSSCMYGIAYLIVMPLLLQKSFNLAEINSPPPSAWKTFIDLLHYFSTTGSHTWKTSTNSSFDYKYATYDFCVFASNSMVA